MLDLSLCQLMKLNRKLILIQEIEREIHRLEDILINTPKEMKIAQYTGLLEKLKGLKESLIIVK